MLAPAVTRLLSEALPTPSRTLRASTISRVSRRSFIGRAGGSTSRRQALESLNVQRLSQESQDFHRTRRNFLAAGAVAGIVSFAYTAWKLQQALSNPDRLDSALSRSDGVVDGTRKVIVHDEEGREIVPTGNSTVPSFPRTLQLPDYAATREATSHPPDNIKGVSSPTLSVPPDEGAETEYTLVGLGTRTVSFLSIQVYVVGYYIATQDIAELQARLVKRINPIASTLVSTEKDDLRQKLLDPAEGEETWNDLLSSGVPARSAFRIVPVRDTDFHHLRDGFVRAIQARADKHGDEEFGEAMRGFRHIFNHGKVPKRRELFLVRDQNGRLDVVYDDGRKALGKQLLGTVEDGRISKALWLNYLAGSKVASEPARISIVQGIMEFVERPVGTIAGQVL